MMAPNIQLIVYLINTVVGLIILVMIWKRKVEKWHTLLLLFVTNITLGILLYVLNEYNLLNSKNVQTLNRIPYYTVFLSAVIFCYITFAFTRSSISRGLWIAMTLIWLTVLIMSFEVVQIIQVKPELQIGSGSSLMIAGWGFFMITSNLHMLFAYRKVVYPLHRNRYKYWFLVMIVLVLGSGLIIGGPLAFGFSLLTVSAVLISFISLSHKLPDIRQILKKTLALSLTTFVSVLIYAGSIFLFQSAGELWTRTGMLVLFAFFIAAGLVIIVNPLINMFHSWISQKISGNNLDSSRVLGNYSKDISNIIDINQLSMAIIHNITAGLQFQYGELFTLEKNDDQYILQLINRGVSGHDSTQLIRHLEIESPITQWFLHEKRAITQYDLDFHPKLLLTKSSEKEWITGYKMDIFVPIYSQNEWIGLLAFGPKANGDRIFEDEVSILQSLADQTAVGLRNARLYEDLKQRNTENEKLNSDLSEANQELARLDEAKSDFISIASHEIRTPLTQIIGYNDILNDMVKGGNIPRTAGMQMIDGVQKAARRLEDIVDTMFDVSKLDTRTLDLHFTEILLSDVITQSTEKWMMALEDRKQTFIVKGMTKLPAIQADSRRLKQVFSNIIQNAIKYTPDGGQICVTGQSLQQNLIEGTFFVEVAVSDTGVGINSQDLEKIFEKFYRVGNVMLHSSGETKFKGAGPGLGLTIARGIVEAHGGKIWAESPGNDDDNCPGSTFHVILPITQEVRS